MATIEGSQFLGRAIEANPPYLRVVPFTVERFTEPPTSIETNRFISEHHALPQAERNGRTRFQRQRHLDATASNVHQPLVRLPLRQREPIQSYRFHIRYQKSLNAAQGPAQRLAKDHAAVIQEELHSQLDQDLPVESGSRFHPTARLRAEQPDRARAAR